MRREFSVYLDLIRFVAALMVVVYHSNIRLLITEKLPFSNHGHTAVIIFFVLSGYVISYISSTKETSATDYWASRLSRFYSLVIPVIVLCPVIDLAGEALAPQFYVDKTTHGLALLRIFASLTFLNEIWRISIMPFSNTPYWSVCYEMWYYIFFAIATFTKGNARVFLLVFACCLVGPKILLLAPIWILGVVLHRWALLYQTPEWLGWVLFLASIPLYGLFQQYDVSAVSSELLRQWIGDQWHRDLYYSKFFLADYLLALIVAANFAGFRCVAHRFSLLIGMIEKPVRWVAGLTFSLYIFHQPLIQFFAAVFNGNPNDRLFYLEVMFAMIFTIILIISYFERQRHPMRRCLRQWLQSASRTNWWTRHVTMRLAGEPLA